MAVFRIEKTRDYTVMSNHHLRNTALSLKAKGLLSLMLSLPEGWDYTTKGLARICKDGVDSICAGVRELEEQGYFFLVLVPAIENGRLFSWVQNIFPFQFVALYNIFHIEFFLWSRNRFEAGESS